MDGPTSTLDELPDGASGQETRVNDLANALSPSAAFGRRANGISGLTWSFYGVPRYYINASIVTKANGTINITGSQTRYLSIDRALAATEIATAFAPDKLALFKIVAGGSSHTSWEDHRDPHHLNRFLTGYASIAMANANVTLSYEQAMLNCLEFTGSNSATRDVIVPLVPREYLIICSTTTNGLRVIGASGTGITIAVAKSAIVFCDGTNVRRLTADV